MLFIQIALTVIAALFLIWYFIRTPENLTNWYCLPVLGIVILLVIGLWSGWFFK